MKECKKRKNVNQKKGISLIVLVITIIVIVILAVAVILSIANNNPIENANKATFQNDVKSMQEKLELIKATNYANNNGASYNKEGNVPIEISDLSISDKYKDKFKIKNGELVYMSGKLNTEELKWVKELGILSSAYVISNSSNLSNTELTLNDNILSGKYTGDETEIEISGVEKIVAEDVGQTDYGIFKDSNMVSLSIKDVKVIDGVAFSNSQYLETVILDDSVEYIGVYAFTKCRKLKNIKFSDNLKFLGTSSFSFCNGLEEIYIPDSVEEIEYAAFAGCENLKEVSIPGKIIIGTENMPAFGMCSNIEKITLRGETTFTEKDIKSWGIDITKCQIIYDN